MTDTTTQKPSAPQGRGIGKLSSNAKHIVADLGKNGIFLALIAVIVLFSITTDGILLRPQNISNLIVQNGYILILAIGMVLVIVAGHIDLSVGSIAAFIGAISGVFVSADFLGLPWWLAVILSLVVGAIVGAWQGFWIAFVGIPAFIVTLAGTPQPAAPKETIDLLSSDDDQAPPPIVPQSVRELPHSHAMTI